MNYTPPWYCARITNKSTAECPAVYHVFSFDPTTTKPLKISPGCQDLVKDILASYRGRTEAFSTKIGLSIVTLIALPSLVDEPPNFGRRENDRQFLEN